MELIFDGLDIEVIELEYDILESDYRGDNIK